MPWVGLQCVIKVFPDQTHLLFVLQKLYFYISNELLTKLLAAKINKIWSQNTHPLNLKVLGLKCNIFQIHCISISLILLGALNVRFKLKPKIQLSILLGSHKLGRLNMRLTSDSLNGGFT